jgi:hypothetical protein
MKLFGNDNGKGKEGKCHRVGDETLRKRQSRFGQERMIARYIGNQSYMGYRFLKDQGEISS